ncbi:MAG: EscU/YscU/HrcU family type III secretion system export apparatus switch protein [Gammaproteobacteria bacterium]|nr:EscU/YscU/HrcU family type III secretion system export apparatus switch protein [Gammaproteobacteria bacterium]
MSEKEVTPNTTAVALKYDGGMSAPKVVAKGKGEIAQQIMTIAKEHGVPLYEDGELVKLLSRLDLDEEIPNNLYQAVAEVLAFIYSINNKLMDLPSETKSTE